ncbi:hypothetical protein AX774_g444 [Zancudomyces culisetae]|uniref:Uncharacterized protein n=1 Tax=Zancudomyces culisetae TaxID=1213189 RepID=A0A1R1PYF1_ZANCU|nr:hypothetical protein AX774_g444 [Zancudomyces culisetae]|eukprot:OMH85980.1 hypothetical protein AX774_g444 [Zancudomyces culisetae]
MKIKERDKAATKSSQKNSSPSISSIPTQVSKKRKQSRKSGPFKILKIRLHFRDSEKASINSAELPTSSPSSNSRKRKSRGKDNHPSSPLADKSKNLKKHRTNLLDFFHPNDLDSVSDGESKSKSNSKTVTKNNNSAKGAENKDSNETGSEDFSEEQDPYKPLYFNYRLNKFEASTDGLAPTSDDERLFNQLLDSLDHNQYHKASFIYI